MSQTKTIADADDVSIGQVKAVIKKMGGIDNFMLALRHDHEVIVQSKIGTLFDKNGRGIPDNLEALVCNPNKDFRLYTLNEPLSNLTVPGHSRVNQHLLRIFKQSISYDDFKTQAEKVDCKD